MVAANAGGGYNFTPSEFYQESDAAAALAQARMLHVAIRKALGGCGLLQAGHEQCMLVGHPYTPSSLPVQG